MASNDWCLSENDSEEENTKTKDETSPKDSFELGGLTIPPWRVLQLMQMVDQNRTLELDSAGQTYQKKRQKKKKKKRRKNSKGGRGIEDVSETASEIRSTTGTSTTATEYRDLRRPALLAYDDPELDDIPRLPASKELFSRKRVLPPAPQKKLQLASLDKIAAEEQERRQRWKKAQDDSTSQFSSSNNHSSSSVMSGSIPVNAVKFASAAEVNNNATTEVVSHDTHTGGGREDKDVLSFGEDSDDTDDDEVELPYGNSDKDHALPFMTGRMDDSSQSNSDIKVSLLSQINRVEKLLDSDGLT